MNAEHIDIIADILSNCLDWSYSPGEKLEQKVFEALQLNEIKLEFNAVHKMTNEFLSLDPKMRQSPSFDTQAWVRTYLLKEKLIED